MITVTIYQLPAEHKNKFIGSTVDFNRWDYKKVYQCERVDGYTQENAFEEFNINHPEDYLSHSLSVSDIVRIGEEEFFCDMIGWKRVVENKLW